MLADDARHALSGWLAYGAALNEGRALFPSDEAFGQWLVTNKLSDTNQAERAAAMWAAAHPDQFDAARAAGNACTVRGIIAMRPGYAGCPAASATRL